MKGLWKRFKTGFKWAFILTLGYLAHISLETFIVTNALAIFGVSIPVLV